MLKPRIEDFFHSAELSAPEVAHIVEAPVDGVESGVYMRSEKARDNTDQRSVEKHRNADGQIELLVGHQSGLRLALFSHELECAMIEDPCRLCRFYTA